MRWVPPLADGTADNNRYQNDNIAAGIVGSVPDADAFNMLLDEATAVTAALGLAEDAADNTQLLQALQRMVPYRNGTLALSAASVLGPEHQGKIVFAENDLQITLPAAADLADGASLAFISRGGGTQTIVAAAGDSISSAAAGIALANAGDQAEMILADGTWYTRSASAAAAGAAAAGGALIMKAGYQAVPLNTNTAIDWDTVASDGAGAWSAAYPSRLTVPDGASVVRLGANLGMATDNRVTSRQLRIVRNGVPNVNGSDIYGMPRSYLWNPYQVSLGYLAGHILGVQSPDLAVAPGDYFEVWAYISSLTAGITAEIGANAILNVNWFAMDIVR